MTAQQDIKADTWTVAGRTFTSRLIVGTGKYKSFEENAAAVEASGAEIVTVAVRRVNISDPNQPMLTDFIDPKKITYLPNTAGCFTADDAIRTLRLAREAGGWNLVKLEVLGEAKTLYPDMRETLRATEVLVKEGFEPMVYCVDDPIAAKQLEEAGAVAIMPLGAPIGSGLGIQNRVTIRLIVEGAERAGAGRCGCRHRERRGGGDGARLRRRADEHRHRRGQGPGADGAGDEVGGRSGAARLSRRTHAEAPLRRSEQPARGAYLVAVTRCADIGASKPSGPSNCRSASSRRIGRCARAGPDRALSISLRSGRALHQADRGVAGGAARLSSSTVSISTSAKPAARRSCSMTACRGSGTARARRSAAVRPGNSSATAAPATLVARLRSTCPR